MKLLVSALEPSANIHLENLLHTLEDVELGGIFDERFGKPLMSSKNFGVMGFVDVLAKVPMAKRAIKQMANMAKDYECVLLIDSPAFNIPLAKAIKEQSPHVRVVYYILPQVWAWKAKRVVVVESVTDARAAILPFEPRFWGDAKFVGNPLMDEITDKKTEPTNSNITAFLPGSRASEIKKLMPIFREVASKIDGIKILAVPPFMDRTTIYKLYGDTTEFEVVRDAKYALTQASKAVVCSGTATLEAAIIGTPFVLVYKAKWLDYQIAKKFVNLNHIGLANIIADFEEHEEIHPELIQHDVTAENILANLAKMDEAEFLKRSTWLREKLSGKEVELSSLLV
ncbi:MAG: lipid-A-disaccharide synthase [Campylobacterales bacterium]|nr:lipid-A-disaccharide synthase [Campylobacterales bacterium]